MTRPALAPHQTPWPDRFRPRDIWSGPDGKLYVVRSIRSLPDHVRLVPLRGGPSVVEHRSRVNQWRRSRWGGKL